MQRIPILQMGRCLLVTIQVDLQDQTALALQDDLSAKIEATGAHGVLIDISALEIVDSFIGRMLASISGIARVLDATTVVVGMQPAVAITLVELGLSLEGVRTALNVERGMQMLRRPLPRRTALTLPLRARWSCRTEQDIVMSRQTVRKLTQQAEVLAGRPDQDDHRGERAVAQHRRLRRRRRDALGGRSDGREARACASTSRTRAPASPTSSWR